MGGAEVSIRGQKATIIGTPDVNVTDRVSRILGIVYGNLAQLQQRPVTNELLVQLVSAGVQIDPRQIRNLVFADDKVDVSGSAVTVTNVPSSPIIDFNKIPGLGAGSSGTHNYIATGNFRLSSIEVSASGATKTEITSGDVGLETTKLVAFTSGSNLTSQIRFHEELSLTIGQRLKIIITNRELQSMDVYSTVLGFNL